MAFIRSFMALVLTIVLSTTSYAGVIELTKSKAVVSQEKARKELINGLDRAIKKEEKRPTSISELKIKANKKVAKNFAKRRKLFNDIFKYEDQEKRLKKLDKKMAKLIKLDPSIAQINSEADRVELLITLEERSHNLDQEEAQQIQLIDDELSSYATTADYLIDLKSKVESDSLASIQNKTGRAIASVDPTAVYVGLYVLSALAFVGLIYYLVVSATVAIWAFSPALAILFLLIML